MTKPALDPKTKLYTPQTVLFARGLQHKLDAAKKRQGTTASPRQEQRDIETAEAALKVYRETMCALIADAEAQGWEQPK